MNMQDTRAALHEVALKTEGWTVVPEFIDHATADLLVAALEPSLALRRRLRDAH